MGVLLLAIFKNKNNLLFELIDYTLEELRGVVLKHIVSSHPPIIRLEKVVFHLLNYVEENPDVFLVIVRDAGDYFQIMGESYNHTLEITLPFIEPVFKEARKQGDLHALTTKETLDLVMEYIIGHVFKWLLTGRQYDLVDTGVSGIQVLVKGMKKEQ